MMNSYDALTAAYREKARLTNDGNDTGLGDLFGEIIVFAESDADHPEVTAHDMSFLADVLLLAARKLRDSSGAALSCPAASLLSTEASP